MPGSARSVPASSPSARIETCLARFEVTAPQGPISAPETLLDAVRREILPALSEVFEAPDWEGIDLVADQIEVDLGDWPDDPVWSDVRYLLVMKLRHALEQHLPHPAGQPRADNSQPAPLNKPLNRQADAPILMQDRIPAALPSAVTHDPEADPQQPLDGSAPGAKQADADWEAPLAAFLRWIQAQHLPVSVADILSRLGGQADEAAALIAWRAIPEDRRASALPVDDETRRAVLAAVARLTGQPEVGARVGTDAAMPDVPVKDEAPQTGHGQSASRLAASFTGQGLARHESQMAAQAVLARLMSSGVLARTPITEMPVSRARGPALEPDGRGPGTVPDATAAHPSGHVRRSAETGPDAHAAGFGTKRSVAVPGSDDLTDRPDDLIIGQAGGAQDTRSPGDDPLPPEQSISPKALRDLVRLLGSGSGEGAVEDLLRSFRASPQDTFDQTADAGFLGEFAAILAEASGTAGTALMWLDGARLRALFAADPVATEAVVRRLSPVEVLAVLRHLAPAEAGNALPLATRAADDPTVLHDAAVSALRGEGVGEAVLKALSVAKGEGQRKALSDAQSALDFDKPSDTRPTHTSRTDSHTTDSDTEDSNAADSDAADDTPSERSALLSRLTLILGETATDGSPDQMLLSVLAAPQDIFDTIIDAGLFGTLAALSRSVDTLKGDVLIRLDPRRLKLLSAADPVALETALRRLSAADALALAQALVPQGADLLRKTLAQLASQAAAPREALQQAAVLLLRGQPLDLETLADLSQARADSLPEQSGVETVQQFDVADIQPEQGFTEPYVSGTETPLEVVLTLSGLSRTEVDRVMGRGSVQDGTLQEGTQGPRGRTVSSDTLEAHLARLTGADKPAPYGGLEDALRLLWEVWPTATDRVDGGIGEDPGMRHRFGEVRALIAAQISPAESLVEQIDHATEAFEPEPARRTYGLRTAAARLAVPTSRQPEALRLMLRTAVVALLAPAALEKAGVTTERPRSIARTERTAFSGPPQAETELRVTDCAGLVLLHPFYALLFDRLGVGRDGKALLREDLPIALGALQYLAGADGSNDPLHNVLLGLDPVLVVPDPVVPEPPAQELMTGLLRSVIERWGRLGATSPDGLREAFLRRTGTLRFDEKGAHLRVTPGPFDMLLDGMPWRTGPVALPWMPLPCHVSWREAEDA